MTRLLVILGVFLLLVVGLFTKFDDTIRTTQADDGEQPSLFSIFSDDDGGSGDASSGGAFAEEAYFYSLFGDVKFTFRIKNYKALEDDNLNEIDREVH